MTVAPAPRERSISIVIPVRDGAATLERCLEAAFRSRYPRFEVVVVDDASRDASVEIARRFPCRLVRLPEHGGVSRARNAGALASTGELLFFADADCLLQPDTLLVANAAYQRSGGRVVGGTYTPLPHDRDFYSRFQSIFIHHFETKRAASPDYVAAHAMLVEAALFRRSGGFVEGSFIGVAASVEDVELCHRLRRAGCELVVEPHLQVQHVFRFSLRRSLRNAGRKARYWTAYSLLNRDVLADSGAASRELKANVAASALTALLAAAALVAGVAWPLLLAAPLLGVAGYLNRRLFAAFAAAQGPGFAARAALYYATLYAAAVALGAAAGVVHHAWNVSLLRRYRSCAPPCGTCGPCS